MARILGLLPSALIAARNGMSANAFARQLRDLGMGARRSEVLRIMGVAKGIIARTPDEPFRPIDQAPSPGEIGQWPSKNATGVAQTVTLIYRDKITGQVQQTWWRTVTPGGIKREDAIASAIDAYSDNADMYEQEIIGAIHTSAYNLVPGLMLCQNALHIGYRKTGKKDCPLAWFSSIRRVPNTGTIAFPCNPGVPVAQSGGGQI